MNQQLMIQQEDLSDRADAKGITYADVTPEQLFGSASSSMLKTEIMNTNPRVYYAKRLEWYYQTGIVKKPLSVV